MASDLGSSNIPYSPMIVESKRAGIQPTFYEYLSIKGTRILKEEEALNTTGTIYQVPVGKVLFITAMAVNVSTNGTAGYAQIRIPQGGTNIPFLRVFTGATNDGVQNSVNFAIPLVFVGGETLQIQGVGNLVRGVGSILGFEIEKDAIPVI